MRSTYLVFVFTLLALLSVPAFVSAQEATGGAKVYKQSIHSVVWIHSTRPNGLATGSGSLIDAERRLVLTNFHVVEENAKVMVFFPAFREGQPIPEKQYYADRVKRLGVPGKVIALDRSADLAIIQLESLPEGAKAVTLATGSPDPGEVVHSIGNAGKSGALWGYVKGTVRQVYRKKWKAALDKRHVVNFEAKVIETDSPTNPGDSGGPLLNDNGELVGVTQGGAMNAQLVSFFVDLSEVKQLLATRDVKAIKGSTVATKPTPKRTTPVPITDDAKLFKPETIQSAEVIQAELFKKDVEVIVETFKSAPADWVEKAKKATPDERQLMFREFVESRLKAEKSDGMMVLICLEPRMISVQIPERVRKLYPDKTAQKVGDILIKAGKDKKFDDGLIEALKLLQDSLKGAKK